MTVKTGIRRTGRSLPRLDRRAEFLRRPGFEAGTLTEPVPPEPLSGDRSGVLPVGDGTALIYIIDAPGHGDGASILADTLELELLKAFYSVTAPLLLMEWLNGVAVDLRILAAVSLLHCSADRILVAVAGSLPPTVFEGGAIDHIPAEGPLIGLTRQPDFTSGTRALAPGTQVVGTSDGVTDVEGRRDSEPFRIERFAEVLDPERSVAANLLDLRSAVLRHGEQHDDISLLLVRADSQGQLGVRLPSVRPSHGASGVRIPPSQTQVPDAFEAAYAACVQEPCLCLSRFRSRAA